MKKFLIDVDVIFAFPTVASNNSEVFSLTVVADWRQPKEKQKYIEVN